MPAKQALMNGIVVFAKDTTRVAAFYQKVLDLKITESQKSHTVLAGGDIEVVIHAIPAKVAATITIDAPPQPRASTAIKPAFRVDDLKAVKIAVEQTGGTLKPLKAAWSIRGAKVLDGTDPEGNVVQFKQLI